MYHHSNSFKSQKAVALEYKEKIHTAPKVLASGAGFIAEEIIAIARDNNIPIHTDADLVEILSILEIGTYIPVEIYSVIAEIFIHIYKQNDIQKNK